MLKKIEKNINLSIKLAAPAQLALPNAGITILKQLSKSSEEEIMRLHGMGKNAAQKIKEALNDSRFSFAERKIKIKRKEG
jgi:DNA-directed RNA polymerase alpha subunit